MLTLTADAATLVRGLTEAADLPAGAGMRIDVDAGSRSLRMSIQPSRGTCEELVQQDGALVFLEPTAAERLDDRTLDAVGSAGHQVFLLGR